MNKPATRNIVWHFHISNTVKRSGVSTSINYNMSDPGLDDVARELQNMILFMKLDR